MTITTEPPMAGLQLRDGESPTIPGYCAMCGWDTCTSRFTAEGLCYETVRPKPLSEWARFASYRVLRDLELQQPAKDWPSGTGDMLRALAAELTEWADSADLAARAAQRREADQ